MEKKTDTTQQPQQTEPKRSNKSQRIITGVIFGVTAALCLVLHIYTLHLLEAVLTFIIFFEMNTVFNANKTEKLIGLSLYIFNQITLLCFTFDVSVELYPFISFIVYSIYALYTHDIIKSMKLFFASFWTIHCLSYAIGCVSVTGSRFVPLYIVFTACYSDGMQYAFGRMFGKTRPLTYLSPNKSLEGYAGGLVAMIVLALIAEESIVYMIFVMYLVGICGDLMASCLKRQLGVKDFGKVLPGMGGMFDRLDSITICMAASYYWFKFMGYHPGTVIKCIQHYFYFTDDECPI